MYLSFSIFRPGSFILFFKKTLKQKQPYQTSVCICAIFHVCGGVSLCSHALTKPCKKDKSSLLFLIIYVESLPV